MLDGPCHARLFFAALVQDDLVIGRPREVPMLVARPLGGSTRRPYEQTSIFSAGADVQIEFRYQHSRVN